MSSLSKGCEKSKIIEELLETRLLIVRSAPICEKCRSGCHDDSSLPNVIVTKLAY